MTTPLVSLYSNVDQTLGMNQLITFEQTGINPTTSNLSVTPEKQSIIIQDYGIYEITYGVTSKTGGLFSAFTINSIGIPPIFPNSQLYVNPNTSASLTFQVRIPGRTQFGIVNTNYTTRNTITINTDSQETDSRCKALSAYIVVKKVSS